MSTKKQNPRKIKLQLVQKENAKRRRSTKPIRVSLGAHVKVRQEAIYQMTTMSKMLDAIIYEYVINHPPKNRLATFTRGRANNGK